MVATNYDWDPLFDCINEEFSDASSVIASYTQAPIVFGEVQSQVRSGESRFFHYDVVGTTRSLTASDQTISDTTVYSGYGELVFSAGSTSNRFGYVGSSGYYTDANSGKVYVRARFYRPWQAAWLSIDPDDTLRYREPYVYSQNSPALWIDPSGFAKGNPGWPEDCARVLSCAGLNWVNGRARAIERRIMKQWGHHDPDWPHTDIIDKECTYLKEVLRLLVECLGPTSPEFNSLLATMIDYLNKISRQCDTFPRPRYPRDPVGVPVPITNPTPQPTPIRPTPPTSPGGWWRWPKTLPIPSFPIPIMPYIEPPSWQNNYFKLLPHHPVNSLT